MPIICVTLDNSNTKPYIFRAIQGKVYRVTNIHASVIDSGNNSIHVMDRHYETLNTATAGIKNTIFSMACDDYQSLSVPYKTIESKYLTVVRGGSNSFEAILIIEYEFIKATKTTLIWEYIRNKVRRS